MPHEYAGHYSTKHPKGTTYDPALAAALTNRAENAGITCTQAHEVAKAFEVPPSEVGRTADLLELRIVQCQMGLFGYSPEKRIVKPAEHVPDELRARIEAATNDGRITCAACWKIAQDLGLQKTAVSAACERLGLKIKNCQIGAF
jgi:hypothetical protein